MIRRPTWILLAIFVIVLAAAWLWQRNSTKKAEAAPTPTSAPMLLDIDPNNIRDLKIKDAQGKQLYLRRLGGGVWIMTEPERQNVDMDKVTTVVQSIAFIDILSTLSTPPPTDQIGLATPAYVVTITDQTGKSTIFEVGAETPTQTGYYIRMNGTVYVVSKMNIDNLVDMLKNPPVAPPTATATGSVTPQTIITGTQTIQSTPAITVTP